MNNSENYYIYLISSLPMLRFGMKAPFSFDKFLAGCRRLMPDYDAGILASVVASWEDPHNAKNPVLKKWYAFDMALRNELVKIRAARKKTDPVRYIRRDGYADPSISHIAINAYRARSILDGEKALDQERWRFLDELSFSHYFDIEALLVYALKLLILEKWDRINSADKRALIEDNTVKG